MIHLREIRFGASRDKPASSSFKGSLSQEPLSKGSLLKGSQSKDTLPDTFPYNVPVIRNFQAMTFDADITFFVGENGSGKSTLLETIACAADLPTIGSISSAHDDTLQPQRDLSQRLQWAWQKRTRRGFFMRSEDFFGFAKRIQQTRAELERDLQALDDEARDGQSVLSRNLQKMPYARELHAIKQHYGDGLDAQSHGESYFTLFQSRFVPGGLYLMDEPEAPLSPMRQLALITLLKEMVNQDAQFIIATHSPILLAYPGATIYTFDEGHINRADYDTLEHVTITRSFLNDPQAFLRHLMGDAWD